MSNILKKKIKSRERTKFRIRKKIQGTSEKPRMSIFRSSKHTYAQLISDNDGKTVASASTHDKDVVKMLKGAAEGNKDVSTKSVIAAKLVGVALAKKVTGLNVTKAVFDRNGYSYTGRVKAVAEGAREGGLVF